MQSNFYLDFENKFRGDRKSVTLQFSKYDNLVKSTLKYNSNKRFLDIGCGRGEWLERWKDHADECIGIESNQGMIEACKKYQLNVIEGDAVKALSKLNDESFSLITIFHVIEHLEQIPLMELLKQVKRILTKDGLLIMETPSIDNLIVSSKSFYSDPTHINHINPDGLKFSMENIGFKNIKYFYIHGGPLQNATPLKITRILNGVAQDLLIIGTKSEIIFQKIFNNYDSCEKDFQIGLTTLEAAIEHDLLLEKINKKVSEDHLELVKTVNNLNEEIEVLKSNVKYIIYFKRLIKIVIMPVLIFLRLIRKLIIAFGDRLINFLYQYKYTKKILLSSKILFILNYILKNFLGSSSVLNSSLIERKFNNRVSVNSKSEKFNKRLLTHYRNSPQSKQFKQSIHNNLSNKKSK